jgi:hypothetical protein
MSTADIFISIATLIGAFASGLAALEQKLIKKLTNRKATTANKAVKLENLHPPYLWCLNRLKYLGAIKEVKSGELYFIESNFKLIIKKRVIGVIILMITSFSIIAILKLFIE